MTIPIPAMQKMKEAVDQYFGIDEIVTLNNEEALDFMSDGYSLRDAGAKPEIDQRDARIKELEGEIETWKSRSEINGKCAFKQQDRADLAERKLEEAIRWMPIEDRPAFKSVCERLAALDGQSGEELKDRVPGGEI